MSTIDRLLLAKKKFKCFSQHAQIDKLIESLHEFNLDEEKKVGKMCKLGICKGLFVTCFYNYVGFCKLTFKGCASLCIACVRI